MSICRTKTRSQSASGFPIRETIQNQFVRGKPLETTPLNSLPLADAQMHNTALRKNQPVETACPPAKPCNHESQRPFGADASFFYEFSLRQVGKRNGTSLPRTPWREKFNTSFPRNQNEENPNENDEGSRESSSRGFEKEQEGIVAGDPGLLDGGSGVSFCGYGAGGSRWRPDLHWHLPLLLGRVGQYRRRRHYQTGGCDLERRLCGQRSRRLLRRDQREWRRVPNRCLRGTRFVG